MGSNPARAPLALEKSAPYLVVWCGRVAVVRLRRQVQTSERRARRRPETERSLRNKKRGGPAPSAPCRIGNEGHGDTFWVLVRGQGGGVRRETISRSRSRSGNDGGPSGWAGYAPAYLKYRVLLNKKLSIIKNPNPLLVVAAPSRRHSSGAA